MRYVKLVKQNIIALVGNAGFHLGLSILFLNVLRVFQRSGLW